MKNSNIEILRIFCAFFVVFFHQYTAYHWGEEIIVRNYLIPLLVLPINIFMLITGYFKCKSNNYNIFNTLFLILICWILNLLIQPLIMWDINGKLTYNINLLLGGRDWWYIWAFLLIQLISPLLNLIVNNIKKYYLLTVILVLIILFWVIGFQKYGQFFSFSNIVLFIIMYFIGAYIRNYFVFDQKNLYKWIFIPLTIIMLITFVLINKFTSFLISDSTSDPILIFSSTMLFICFICFKPTNNKVINYIGSSTVFIYLFHYLFDNIVNFYIKSYFNEIDINLVYLICASLTSIFALSFALLIAYPINLYSYKLANIKIFKRITSKSNIFNKEI